MSNVISFPINSVEITMGIDVETGDRIWLFNLVTGHEHCIVAERHDLGAAYEQVQVWAREGLTVRPALSGRAST